MGASSSGFWIGFTSHSPYFTTGAAVVYRLRTRYRRAFCAEAFGDSPRGPGGVASAARHRHVPN